MTVSPSWSEDETRQMNEAATLSFFVSQKWREGERRKMGERKEERKRDVFISLPSSEREREREEKDGLSDRGERRRKLGKMMIVSKKQSANNKNG